MPLPQRFLDAIKGWPRDGHLDIISQFGAAAIAAEAKGGMVTHLDPTSGEYVLGVGDLAVMPVFMLSSFDDRDVRNFDVNPATTKNAAVSVVPGSNGAATGLPASGAYELVSTELVDALDPNFNDALTSPVSGGDAGKLEEGTLYTDTIVGLASRGIVEWDGEDAVLFWSFPVFPTP